MLVINIFNAKIFYEEIRLLVLGYAIKVRLLTIVCAFVFNIARFSHWPNVFEGTDLVSAILLPGT